MKGDQKMENVYRSEEIGKKITIDGKTVIFYNEARGARDGFNHFSEMYIDGERIASVKVHYINRTWECYRFQSAMKKAVYSAAEEATEKLISIFKETKGRKRVTKEERALIINTSPVIAFYNKIYQSI